MDSVSVRAFDVIDSIKSASTREELDSVVGPIFAELGFPWFAAATFFQVDRTPRSRVLLGKFHPEWAARYMRYNYSRSSRISGELLHTRGPYSWSEAIERRGIDQSQRRIWDEARDFGLNDGLFVPVSWTDGSYSAVVLGGMKPPVDDARHRTIAEVVSVYYGHHGRRMTGRGHDIVTLTPRQRECLAWVACGKSSADIAQIIGTTATTVDEHVATACRKLGVRTRTQAAIEAVLRGLISP